MNYIHFLSSHLKDESHTYFYQVTSWMNHIHTFIKPPQGWTTYTLLSSHLIDEPHTYFYQAISWMSHIHTFIKPSKEWTTDIFFLNQAHSQFINELKSNSSQMYYHLRHEQQTLVKLLAISEIEQNKSAPQTWEKKLLTVPSYLSYRRNQ